MTQMTFLPAFLFEAVVGSEDWEASSIVSFTYKALADLKKNPFLLQEMFKCKFSRFSILL